MTDRNPSQLLTGGSLTPPNGSNVKPALSGTAKAGVLLLAAERSAIEVVCWGRKEVVDAQKSRSR